MGGNRRREGEDLGVNFGRPTVTNGDFVAQLRSVVTNANGSSGIDRVIGCVCP